MVSVRSWILIISIFNVFLIKANNIYPQKFEHLSIEDGLPHNNVFSALQDENGFLWFGTANGLTRYDGYRFQIFKFNPDNSNSLSSNYIRCLIEDSYGNIWAGTDNGLNRFNTKTGNFSTFLNNPDDSTSLSNNDIRALWEDQNGNIWIGTSGGGINQINNSDKQEDNIQFKRQKFSDVKKNYVFTIYEDKNNNIWLGTESNLILYHKESDTNNYNIYHFQLLNSNDYSIRHITGSVDNSLLISTFDGGVIELTLLEKKLGFYPPEQCVSIKTIVNGNSKLTNASFIDLKGNLWIGTRGGGIAFCENFRKNNKFYLIKNSPRIKHSISGNFINGFFEDDSGIIWILTNGEGICKYIPNRKPFHIMGDQIFLSEQLRYTSSAIEDDNGDLIIGRRDRGLIKYEFDKNSKKKNTDGKLVQLNWADKKDIKKIIKVDNNFWMVTSNAGIMVFNQQGKLLKHFETNANTNSLSHNYVYELFQDSRGLIWIGTWGGSYGGGLDMYNPVTDKFIHFSNKKGDTKSLSQNIVLSVEEDAFGQIWVGTRNAGLNLLKKNKEGYYFKQFKNIPGDQKSLNGNHVTDIFNSRDNILWIATESGLNQFNYDSQNFERINLNRELNHQKISSISEDENKNLWLTTSTGLIKYNPQTKEALSFNSSDGLQPGYKDGLTLSYSNNLVFFGHKGLLLFDPDEIKTNNIVPPVVLTDIKIFNIDENNSKNARLHLTIPTKDKITLPFDENNFSIEFAALSYISQEKNQYAYRLDGYDKKDHWNYVGSKQRMINYSNLREGEYKFRIKASNNDGIWNEEGKTLELNILPPYYRTKLAYFIYFVFITGLVLIVFRLIVKREEERNKLKIERLEHKKTEELNQSKLRFFTNISHEFRTPLTLILAPTERLLKSSGLLSEERKSEIYFVIHKNASRLLRLINELMDFRKLEAGSLKLKKQNSDIVQFIRSIYSCFEEIAEEQKIAFYLNVPREEIITSFDPDKLEKVLYNLLSNAFKFTPKRGRISLSLFESNEINKVVVQVEDNGKGIQPKDIDRVFERFHQGEGTDDELKYNQGTGIGLTLAKNLVEMHGGEISVTSVPNEKTCFTVSIPLMSENDFKNQMILQKEALQPEIKYAELKATKNDSVENSEFEKKNEKKYTLLIVDDNPEIRTFLKTEFQSDYNIIEAENGKTGLERVQENKPQLIVSDVMMPEMDGFEFCRNLKSNVETSHIPVILLTAKSTEDSLIEGLETGADAYVSKPFNNSILQVRVRKLIELRNNLRNLYSSSLELEPKSLVTNSIDEDFLNKAIAVVEENLDDTDLNIEKFCREMGMGKTTLHEKLKALTGKSTGEFIRSIRLKHAARLLKEGKLNVSEVCYMVGFNTVWYFSKCFKKEFDVSPSNYHKGEISTAVS